MTFFKPDNYNQFHFESYELIDQTIFLRYSIDQSVFFEERIVLDKTPLPECVSDYGLHLLHLAAGLSYYKSIGFKELVNNNATSVEAKFFEDLYSRGLGEFAYLNQLDNFDDIKFQDSSSTAEPRKDFNLTKTVIPIGGGKDSLLSIELMKEKSEDLHLFALARPGQEEFYKKLADKAGLPLILLTRIIDPQILEINKNGAYNGHIPFSAILAFTLAAVAPIYSIKNAVLSNESSANSPNLVWNNKEINHQYSKSFDFEKKFFSFIKENYLENFNYFSLLRPYSELEIIKKFSETNHYDQDFTSCNKYFSTNYDNQNKKWCGHCSKCAFFFLLAAPFFEQDRLISIFQENLFENKNLFSTYEKLIGVKEHKPFDCVGTVEECLAAFSLILNNEDWNQTKIVKKIKKLYYQKINSSPKPCEKDASHLVPKEYL